MNAMPIPKFSIDGVLPPYSGSSPAESSALMSPFEATAAEVAASLGTTERRREILRGWLEHRAALWSLGFQAGFQWLDGSFVEDKIPNDLDAVIFVFRPEHAIQTESLQTLISANLTLFQRDHVKSRFKLDVFFIDMNGSPTSIVNLSRYFLQLFSHRRDDGLWKGILQVPMAAPADDRAALEILERTEQDIDDGADAGDVT